MSEQARVEDLEAFAIFRAALMKFAQMADLALTAADSEIARTQFWLETEQSTVWRAQLRKRGEAVVKAREMVRQKKLYKDATGRVPSAVEEEKALTKCMAALHQAEEKVVAIKKALPKLQKANDMYRGGVARLKIDVVAEIPKGVALLDRLAGTLEQYLQIEVPEAALPTEAAPATEGGMSRGDGDVIPAPADKPDKTGNDIPASRAEGEGQHVVNG